VQEKALRASSNLLRHQSIEYTIITILGAYFPWVLMGFHFLVGDDITLDLFGVAAGHSYVVLKDFLPITHNKRYLETPRFLYCIHTL
jgi:Derlin-2/3